MSFSFTLQSSFPLFSPSSMLNLLNCAMFIWFRLFQNECRIQLPNRLHSLTKLLMMFLGKERSVIFCFSILPVCIYHICHHLYLTMLLPPPTIPSNRLHPKSLNSGKLLLILEARILHVLQVPDISMTSRSKNPLVSRFNLCNCNCLA